MQRFLHCYVALMILAPLRLCAQEPARATVEFPRPDGVVTIQADRIERIIKGAPSVFPIGGPGIDSAGKLTATTSM